MSAIIVLGIILLLIGMAYREWRGWHLDQFELEGIRSTNVKKCAHCGVCITQENDSGWEVFVNAKWTQPVCCACDEKLSQGGKLE